MNSTRSAAIFDEAELLGTRIVRLARAPILLTVLSVAVVVSCIPQALAIDPLAVNQARIIGDEARTRIVLDFVKESEFDVHYDSSARIIVDFPAAHSAFLASDLKPISLFSDVRVSSIGQNSTHAVLTAKKPMQVAITEMKQSEDSASFRFVLDKEITTKGKLAELVKIRRWQTPAPATTGAITPGDKTSCQAEFVIAVDPGHGGIDTGASGGTTGTEEKVITLMFAKELAERLNREPGIKAFLTHDSDTFLALSERVAIARSGNANLFISLHADTLKQKGIRGATVYTLSDRASDRMAQELAERENKSDQIAGVTDSSEPPEVADILLDFTRRETQAFSVTLAENIVSSFEGEIGLINNPHRYAGFMVLRAHDVPSVLLELGFLSNPDDEKLLLDAEWRKKVADTLATAVERYRTKAAANGS